MRVAVTRPGATERLWCKCCQRTHFMFAAVRAGGSEAPDSRFHLAENGKSSFASFERFDEPRPCWPEVTPDETLSLEATARLQGKRSGRSCRREQRSKRSAMSPICFKMQLTEKKEITLVILPPRYWLITAPRAKRVHCYKTDAN